MQKKAKNNLKGRATPSGTTQISFANVPAPERQKIGSLGTHVLARACFSQNTRTLGRSPSRRPSARLPVSLSCLLHLLLLRSSSPTPASL